MINKKKRFVKDHLFLFEIIVAFVLTMGMVYISDVTFSQNYLLVLLYFIALFVLLRKGIGYYSFRRFKLSLWFALPMGLAFWLGHRIVFQSVAMKSLGFFDIPFILIAVMTFCLMCICVFGYIDKKSYLPKKTDFISKKYWFIATLIVLVCWLPLFLCFFPGLISVDAAVQIRQVIGDDVISNWHPVLHTLFMALPTNIGMAIFGDLTAGIALTTIVQMIIMALIFGYVVWWVSEKTQKRWVGYAVLIFFALCPIVAVYAVTLWKDVLFSGLMLLLVIRLYDLVTIKKRDEKIDLRTMVILLVLIFLVAFFRNGGILIMVGLGVTLLFYYKKSRLMVAISFLFAIVTTLVVQGPVYRVLNIESSPFMESMSIPAQQFGYLVHEDRLNEEETLFLSQYADIDKLRVDYDPMDADPAKNSFDYYAVEEDKIGFLGMWWKFLTRHFGDYIYSYLLHTYSYWYVQSDSWVLDISHVHDKMWLPEEYSDISLVGEKNKEIITKIEKGFVESSWGGWLGSTSVMFWSMILILIVFLYQKKYFMLVPMAGILLYMASLLVASPVPSIFRYVYSLLLIMPILLMTCFIKIEKGVKR